MKLDVGKLEPQVANLLKMGQHMSTALERPQYHVAAHKVEGAYYYLTNNEFH